MRIWSCGFGLQDITGGVESDVTTGSPTISTAIKHSGAASIPSAANNPTVVLNSPASGSNLSDSTPTLYFTGTDTV